jgi:hypothetical protein
VALVEHLPERDLGVARDVNVLGTVRDELHKTTTHVCLYPGERFFFGRPHPPRSFKEAKK